MKATLTLIGLWGWDRTIFDNFSLPDIIDKDVLIHNLMSQYSTCELIYPDPDYLKFMIGMWSSKQRRVWDDLAETLTYTYDPIYNYDRREEHWYVGNESESVGDNLTSTSTNGGRSESSSNLDDTRTDNTTTTNNLTSTTDMTHTSDMEHNTRGTDDTITSGTTNVNSDTTVSNYEIAFNTAAENLHSRSVTDGTDNTVISNNQQLTRDMRTDDIGETADKGTVKDTGDIKNTGTVTDVQNASGTSSYNDTADATSDRNIGRDKSDDHHEYIRAFGNIGVTTTQQMIESQREVVMFNLYDLIIKQFAAEFLLLVY